MGLVSIQYDLGLKTDLLRANNEFALVQHGVGLWCQPFQPGTYIYTIQAPDGQGTMFHPETCQVALLLPQGPVPPRPLCAQRLITEKNVERSLLWGM